MGTVTSSLFGSISGKVGNVVFRKRGGKIYVATKPRKRQSAKNAGEIEREKIFALTGKISTGINSTELLKYFWRPVAAKYQSSYNLIFKKNYGELNIENLCGNVFMTPTEGFRLTDPTIYPGDTNLLIECKALGDNSINNSNADKYVTAVGIIILKNPATEEMPLYKVIAFKSNKYLFYPHEYISLSVEFFGDQLMQYGYYSLKKVFAAFVTTDADDKPIQHSITFTNK
jgi:hypothetical protein